MMQSFRCPACGNFNALGEPFCTNCGQRFVYNCPVCGSPVNKFSSNCTSCGTAFSWNVQSQNPASPPAAARQSSNMMQDSGQPRFISMHTEVPEKLTRKPVFWIVLTIICAILIAAIFVIDAFLNK